MSDTITLVAADTIGAADAGFDHHFITPVDPSDLNTLLARVATK